MTEQDIILSITDSIPITNPVLISMHREADTMQAFLSSPACLEDPASMTYRLNSMDAYISRLSSMVSKARAMRDRAQTVYYEKKKDDFAKLKVTEVNRLVKNFLFEFNATVDRLETMYSAMMQIDKDLVSQISYVKQQMVMR